MNRTQYRQFSGDVTCYIQLLYASVIVTSMYYRFTSIYYRCYILYSDTFMYLEVM